MTITLDLKPEAEAGLKAQAEAAGLSLAQFLSRELEAIAPAVQSPETSVEGDDQSDKEFDEWLDSFPQHPVLREEAVKRENWYPDR